MALNVERSYNPKLDTKYYLSKNRSFRFTNNSISLKNIGGIDLIKNLGNFFNQNFYKNYQIKKLTSDIINNEEVFVIDFYKNKKFKKFDFKGKIYINKKDFAILKVDITWGDGDIIVGEYKKINGLYYMMNGKGIRTKKHFGTTRISTTEMINTEIIEGLPNKIEGKLISSTDIISNYETQENDTTFWKNYNTIIPNEKVAQKISQYDFRKIK
ncbi:hypothetical protein [Bergeyella sp. RCAD1439]|uniref:hypothetical protein n=1 Tax=Bergeyella anatis TaxID=3113737 RepID=UPI002E186789|nr:hypothetical protein [Bergeyella sp. RCAD1439]